jgi:hypothetical protein
MIGLIVGSFEIGGSLCGSGSWARFALVLHLGNARLTPGARPP